MVTLVTPCRRTGLAFLAELDSLNPAFNGADVHCTGLGTLLQDLREDFLETFGGIGEARDRCAADFDERLASLAAEAFAEEAQ